MRDHRNTSQKLSYVNQSWRSGKYRYVGSSKRENYIDKQLERMFFIFAFVFHLNEGGNEQAKIKGYSSVTVVPSVRTGTKRLVQILWLKHQKQRKQLDIQVMVSQ